jgi:hypothetical protein
MKEKMMDCTYRSDERYREFWSPDLVADINRKKLKWSGI